ncbi:MAG: DUF2179 domain-containing protein [Desulfovibrionales bacterium]
MSVAHLFLGIFIFLAEVVALTLGTVRMLSLVQGAARTAFVLGTLEMTIWITATSAVLTQVSKEPFLGVCYVLGFAAGNVAGILVERKLAPGRVVLRAITPSHGGQMAAAIREAGYAVTTIPGSGATGPVTILFVVCMRKDLKEILPVIKRICPTTFYSTEPAGEVSTIHRPDRRRSFLETCRSAVWFLRGKRIPVPSSLP